MEEKINKFSYSSFKCLIYENAIRVITKKVARSSSSSKYFFPHFYGLRFIIKLVSTSLTLL